MNHDPLFFFSSGHNKKKKSNLRIAEGMEQEWKSSSSSGVDNKN